MKKLLWIGLAFLVVFVGCDLVSRDYYRAEDDFDPTKGTLVFTINGGSIATKTLSPNMDVADYHLTWDGPGTDYDGIEIITTTGNLSINRSGLPSGSWTLTVNARNSDGVIIGGKDGIKDEPNTFGIPAGGTADIDITVTPISVDTFGDLRVYVQWPTDAGTAEKLTATLDGTAIIDQDPGTAHPTETGDLYAVYDVAGVWSVRYYTLILQLVDGAELLWGWTEAVRIVDDLGTDSGDLKFDLNLGSTGTLLFDTSTNMNNTVAITLPSIPDFSIGGGVPLSVAATVNPTPDGYEWYLDGNLVTNSDNGVSGATSDTITFQATSTLLTLGNHNLSLIAPLGTTLSSETVEFTVVP